MSDHIIVAPPEKICRNCTHWRVLKNQPAHGECKEQSPRAFAGQTPPTVLGGQPGVVFLGKFPLMSAEDDCDKFEARLTPA